MKKTSIKILAIKSIWYMVAGFISLFSILASSIIFWRSIEIVQSLDYTKVEEYAIVITIGTLLMWLCSLAASSVEEIIIRQIIRR